VRFSHWIAEACVCLPPPSTSLTRSPPLRPSWSRCGPRDFQRDPTRGALPRPLSVSSICSLQFYFFVLFPSDPLYLLLPRLGEETTAAVDPTLPSGPSASRPLLVFLILAPLFSQQSPFFFRRRSFSIGMSLCLPLFPDVIQPPPPIPFPAPCHYTPPREPLPSGAFSFGCAPPAISSPAVALPLPPGNGP